MFGKLRVSIIALCIIAITVLANNYLISNAAEVCENTDFKTGRNFPAGATPFQITSADFNNDGKMDVAVTNNNVKTVSVLLGNGGGEFASPRSFPVAQFPWFIATGDFNNDGKLDIAVSTTTGTTVGILAGDGAGNFVTLASIEFGSNPRKIATGDFNGDDNLDIAVTLPDAAGIGIALGNGFGGFAIPLNVSAGANLVYVGTGDFNGDNRADLISANSTVGTVSLFSGNGDGTFASPAAFALGSPNPNHIAISDYNNDNKLDLAVLISGFPSSVITMPGNGTGGFGAPTTKNLSASWAFIYSADINGDGKKDLYGSGVGSGSPRTSLVLGNGDGTFDNENLIPTGLASGSSTVEDFNGDNKADLVLANAGNSNISIFTGDGTGKFGPTNYTLSNTNPLAITVGDFNNDNKPDVATANRGVSVLLNDGMGGLGLPTHYTTPINPNTIVNADFNNDGKLDLLTLNFNNGNGDANFSAFLGTMQGSFGTAINSTVLSCSNGRSMTVFNYDGDSFPDVAVGCPAGVTIMQGIGNGAFFRALVITGGFTRGVTSGDFNGDGKIDIAASGSWTGGEGITTLLSNGNGTFEQGQTYFAGNSLGGLTKGDFNGDDKLDIAVVDNVTISTANCFVNVLLGNGEGGFSSPIRYQVGRGATTILTSDFNGDNHQDLAISHPNTSATTQQTSESSVSVLFGTGAGTFSPAKSYLAGPLPEGLAAADFNSDGKIDLATPNFAGNDVSLIFNTCQSLPTTSLPSVSITNDVTVNEGDSGTVNMTFNVNLSAASDKTIRVGYYTNPLTANGADYNAINGTLIFAPGETGKTIVVPVKGDLSYEYNEDFSVYLVNSLNATIADGQGVGTITDNDQPPAISISDVSINEGNSGITIAAFSITPSVPSGRPIFVNYATASGTATNGVDFVPWSGGVVIPVGVSTYFLNIAINGDTLVEQNETFNVNLSNSANATITDGQGIGTILNDDIGGTIQLSAQTYSTQEGNNLTITVNRTDGNASGVSVQYAVNSGTAISGQDFNPASGVLTFGANETSKTFTVQTINDPVDEPDETATVVLSNPTGGGTLGTQSSAPLTILDDDNSPSITINDVSVTEGNQGTQFVSFLVRLSAVSAQQVTVNYSTADGTATAGSDYEAASGTLTFPPSTLSRKVSIQITGDTIFEGDETVFVNLGSATNATIADGQGVLTILNDEQSTTNRTKLISVNVAGNGSGNGNAGDQMMTPDGRYVVFYSDASNLVSNDTNGQVIDIFRRDTLTGVTELVSVNAAGTGSGNGRCNTPSISADGRYVVFDSIASDLVPNDTNFSFDIFVRDMQLNVTHLVSVNSAGTGSGDDPSQGSRISANGRYVAFKSTAKNLTSIPDTGNIEDLFVRDLQTGVTSLVTVNSSGTGPANQPLAVNSNFIITPDGRYVLFTTTASNLTTTPDTNGADDIYLRDLQTGTTSLVSIDMSGAAMGFAREPSISANGRYVAFYSSALNVVPNDNNNTEDIFVRDMQTNTTKLVSVDIGGTTSGNGFSVSPIISPDGRYVSFYGSATNLTSVPDANSSPDSFVRDLQTNTTALVSFNSGGAATGNNSSFTPVISADGRYAVFSSLATNLVADATDTNNARDVLVRDLRTNRTTLVSRSNNGTSTGSGISDFASITPDGKIILFRSTAGNLVINDNNSTSDVFQFDNRRTVPIGDFDGDGRADLAVFRPDPGNWYYLRSSDNSFNAIQLGVSTDKIAPGDYDGDGKADLAVYRANTGTWYVLQSSNGSLLTRQFGISADLPVPADFDGDSKTDFAVFRPGEGNWYILQSTNNSLRALQFGQNGDRPVAADYDGDGKADVAVYRSGVWWGLRSSNNSVLSIQFGIGTDKPVPGDYDGDGKSDLAVYRPGEGNWYINKSSDNSVRVQQWGVSTDAPSPSDFDGDGKFDLAIYRDGVWYIYQSSDNAIRIQQFGQAGDIPVHSFLLQ